MTDPLKKPEGISWNAASVELPQMPMLPPGEDAMSSTIAAVLPTLAAPLTANVAALQAKEGMFSGKLVTAQSAYQNADDAGSQSVGQITGMLGQLGQMGGQAASQAGQAGGGGQGGGMFGQMMQQAMQMAQQFGGQGGSGSPGAGAPAGGGAPPAGGSGAPAGPPGTGAAQPTATQPGSTQGGAGQPPAAPGPDPRDEKESRDREKPLLERAEAGPSEHRPNAGPAPIPPPAPATDAEIEDLARRML